MYTLVELLLSLLTELLLFDPQVTLDPQDCKESLARTDILEFLEFLEKRDTRESKASPSLDLWELRETVASLD